MAQQGRAETAQESQRDKAYGVVIMYEQGNG
jgi:hypothetical protein